MVDVVILVDVDVETLLFGYVRLLSSNAEMSEQVIDRSEDWSLVLDTLRCVARQDRTRWREKQSNNSLKRSDLLQFGE